MEKKEFEKKLLDKKISKKNIEKTKDVIFDYYLKNNLNFNNAITLILKIDSLETMLLNSEFKINSNGFVKIKNFPKLIETFFELMNDANMYYLEQTKINEIVKYMNGKLSTINPEYFFDKKIFKRIFYNIDSSKIKVSNGYEIKKDEIIYKISLNIVTNTEEKSEEFNVNFIKNVSYGDDFESSKWMFYYWTLNDFVNELKACVKWLKTN